MVKRKDKERFIAYRFCDPLGSPLIRRDTVLARLLDSLEGKYQPMVFGPAIYYLPESTGLVLDPRIDCRPVGIWVGGRKIKLFEFVEPPPAPGVEFIRQTEFVNEEDWKQEYECEFTKGETDG